MDHALLRTKVTAYFRANLEKGKQRRATLGPYSAEERGSVEHTLDLLESSNSEYWHLFGSDYAQGELDKFFGSTGLSRDDYRDHSPRVLDEIRNAGRGCCNGWGCTPAQQPQRAADAASGPLLSVLFADRKAEAKNWRVVAKTSG